MKWKLISFYTVNTPYEKIVQRLITSAAKNNVDLQLYPIESEKDWVKNCSKKSGILLKAMESFPDYDIAYTDADSIIMKYPAIFDTLHGWDIAYYYMEHRKEILSGTLYFTNSVKSRDLVKRWDMLNQGNAAWDQKNLQEVIEKNSEDLNLSKFLLPEKDCLIYDNKQQLEKLWGEPSIIHCQASRLTRGMILNGINTDVYLPGWNDVKCKISN